MGKHTPGPWDITEYKRNLFEIKKGPLEICLIDTQGAHLSDKNETIADQETGLANANLIACAPELLDTLKDATRLFPHGPFFAVMYSIIEKAEGR